MISKRNNSQRITMYHTAAREYAAKAAILLLMVMCMTIFLGGMTVSAETNMQLTDQAGLLTEEEASEINTQIEELEKSTGWELMAVTTNDAQGFDATYYAEKWFDDYTTKDDGVICAIDMDNREIVIRAFGEAMYYMTDDRTDRILDDAYADISEEAYADTFYTMLSGVKAAYENGVPQGSHLYDEKMGKITTYAEAHRGISLTEFLIALVAALAAGGGTIGVIIGKYRLKFGGYKYPIEKNGSVRLRIKEDHFVNEYVTRRHIPKETSSSSSGSSGRSTTHTGAGGRTSSGGSRKF